MTRPLDRGQFFYMHLAKCKQCRDDWFEIQPTISKTKESKVLEEVVRSNHNDNTTIS